MIRLVGREKNFEPRILSGGKVRNSYSIASNLEFVEESVGVGRLLDTNAFQQSILSF